MLNWLPALLLLLLQTSACPEWSGWVGGVHGPVCAIVTVATAVRERSSSPIVPAQQKRFARVDQQTVGYVLPYRVAPETEGFPPRAGPLFA